MSDVHAPALPNGEIRTTQDGETAQALVLIEFAVSEIDAARARAHAWVDQAFDSLARRIGDG